MSINGKKYLPISGRLCKILVEMGVKEVKDNRLDSFWHDEAGNPCISERLRARLASAYRKGLNHREAAMHCGIKHTDLMEYLAYDEAFRMRAEGLMEHLAIQAKMNVAKSIEEGKMKPTQWYLERRRPEEFSTKTDVSVTTGESEKVREKEIEEMLNKL